MSQSQARVARQNQDIVLKIIAKALGGDLFQQFGLSLPPIVDALPTELPQLVVRTQHTNLLFRLADDNVAHLEFQTTRQAGDLLRFAGYNLAAHAHYARPAYTVVLYGAGIRNAPDILQTGSFTFRVQNILLGREDGTAVLRRLREKAARGEPFTAADRVGLILSPLMRQRRSIENTVRQAAEITQSLPKAQQGSTIGTLLGLTYHYLDEAVAEAILEGLSMANPLQTLIEERMASAEAEGKRQSLRTVLEARFGTLPASLEQRIAIVDSQELDRLLRRAAIATSLSEL